MKNLYENKQETNEFGQLLGYPVDHWLARQFPIKQKMQGYYCILEPLHLTQHANKLYDAFQIDRLGQDWTYLPIGPFKTFAEFESWLANAIKEKIFFAILDNDSAKPQGVASYHDIDEAHGTIEVGSVIYSRALQKTRAATEAMYLMMKHVFDDLGYRRYQWRCNALNQASRKAAERLGFTFEGIFRQAHVFKGFNRDTAWYSIIDSEWPAIKSKLEKWLDPHNFDNNGCQITDLRNI